MVAFIIKKCIGCLSDVEDVSGIPSLAAICGNCKIPLESIPAKFLGQHNCPNCHGKTNLVGVFKSKEGGFVCVYFDCPNPACGKRRMTLSPIGMLKK